MKLRHLLVLGLLAVGPASARADEVPTTGVVVAPGQQDDLLTTPSVQTQGAQRLGGTEIVNPPHDSFGMMQSPDNPSRGNLRQERTGTPRVPGPQTKENAAVVKENRAASAAEAAGIQALAPEQIAFQQANAQAAGTQAAISSAVTSQTMNQEGTPPRPSDSQPALPDQSGAPANQGAPTDQNAPSTGPGSTSAPGKTSPDVMPPESTPPDSGPNGATPPPPPSDASPPAGGTNDGSH